MPVIAECANVLIRNATVESRLAGGMAEFEQNCPNSTFCTDGVICRVGFMDVQDAIAYAASLEGLGFLPSNEAGSPEIAVFQEASGFVFPCPWLQVAKVELDGGHRVMAAWLHGTNVPQFVAPPDWRPGEMFTLIREDMEREYEFVGIKNGVESRRHRVTGEMIYVGRPRIPRPRRWWEFWK